MHTKKNVLNCITLTPLLLMNPRHNSTEKTKKNPVCTNLSIPSNFGTFSTVLSTGIQVNNNTITAHKMAQRKCFIVCDKKVYTGVDVTYTMPLPVPDKHQRLTVALNRRYYLFLLSQSSHHRKDRYLLIRVHYPIDR